MRGEGGELRAASQGEASGPGEGTTYWGRRLGEGAFGISSNLGPPKTECLAVPPSQRACED